MALLPSSPLPLFLPPLLADCLVLLTLSTRLSVTGAPPGSTMRPHDWDLPVRPDLPKPLFMGLLRPPLASSVDQESSRGSAGGISRKLRAEEQAEEEEEAAAAPSFFLACRGEVSSGASKRMVMPPSLPCCRR